jgi:hypothetical protein
LVDFSNSTQDTGIYKLDDGVSFYPVGTFASGSFVSGQDVFVTITREAGSKLVSLFINGTPAGTYADDGDLYLPSASALYLLMDNTTGSAAITETDPGIISYLQVRDGPITAEEVVASLGTICTTVTCGDAAPSATIPSIRCRLDDLRGTVGGATALGKFQSIVGKRLDKAKAAIDGATTLCAQGKSKPSKKKLKRAAKLLASVSNKLNSRSAQKTITDATLRTNLVQSAGTLATDLKTLGAQPQCPTS